MQTTRTFVAIAVPEDLGAKLSRLQSLLAPDVAGVRWSSAPFHMTLAFLGDVQTSELNDVCLAVNQACRDHAPFKLRIEGLGVFPSPSKPRTIWVGLTGTALPALHSLQSAIAAAVAAVGYPHDDAVFRPHITLGRMRQSRDAPRNLTPQVNHFRTWSAGLLAISEVVAYSSTLTSDGPVYAPLSRTVLKKRNRESAP
jgi:2'-5' RNA ligase